MVPDFALPISDFYTLLDSRIYVRTEKRIVALCALESRHGRKELKLYDWKNKETGWKVDLANFNIQSLDLQRVANDARELSLKFNIQLDWK